MRNFFRILNNFTDQSFGMRFQPSPEARLGRVRLKLIEDYQCNVVIDVGANDGCWALDLRKSGYEKEIVSYEPSEAFYKLKSRANLDSLWTVHNMALTDVSNFTSFYIASNNNLSSSTLAPKEILNQHPQIRFRVGQKVPSIRLDSQVFKDGNLYLKIDTQGSEFKVLKGAIKLFSRISVIEFESALTELYDGEKNHYFISQFLLKNGFRPRQVVVTHWDKDLATISIDSIFSRS